MSFAVFCSRRFVILAAAVLCLAALNLTFRIGSEIVTEWDESLYAVTAWELLDNSNWVGTTFLRELDYYNSKPPLNVWLVALAFKAFGTNLVSLRIVSVLSALATVGVLLAWARRAWNPAVALFSGLVLSSCFGFLYVHSGRSANTDAPFTLLVTLTVVTLWAAQHRPWLRVWLGLISAAAFLLRGPAVIMPLVIIGLFCVVRFRRQPGSRPASAIAALAFTVPVAAWAVARWHLDGWLFFERMLGYDMWARSVRALEQHTGSPLYYGHILVKHHYEWILAGIAACGLCPVPWPRLRGLFGGWRGEDGLAPLVGVWAAVTLLTPTIMRTKVAWYLNPFYPVFALAIGWALARGLSQECGHRGRRRRVALALVPALMLGVAEGKLLWYTFHHRDLASSTQGLLLSEQERLGGQTIFGDHWNRAEIFVIGGVIGANRSLAAGLPEFMRDSQPGDFLVSSRPLDNPALDLVRSSGHHRLYHRR
jgi:4-amino-4-deoxy-L-arabinose transferase-like glycosyltransferase